MNIIKIIGIIAISIATASAEPLCSTQTPKTCVDVTKIADKAIPGSFYFTCPVTTNGKVSHERLPGNCKNEATCATLQSFYTSKLNSMHSLPISAGKHCDKH